ncbi:hypothetical protein PARPLA_02311 [Rhodobacteraceae bacterium THAF1]|uniref:VOC family protein n=1 Tax=Palleronia sp. THAF1 TaxID=2587842 RepID=UPI000F3C8355|nr:VOC family protein [Palleronia sp. THAF1]QFU09345.1 hypothetical protein FIU81_11735 [Palleronia sp. THAF1]VDC26804.1 hypothetical protein PARPLA_02311 [Rhodobacteraceae bacterium THAF1]
MKIDHLVVTCADLDTGTAAVSETLGVPLQTGGKHPLMGTHNRLLSLGDAYLEVIAIDPDAPAPDRPRWFDLDNRSGAPALTNWVASAADMDRAVAEAPMGMGEVHDLSRGDLAWRMAIPPSGALPFDGVLPALLQWRGARAQDGLEPQGCKIKRLILTHPRMGDIQAAWPDLARTDSVVLEVGQRPEIAAEIVTPTGLKVLRGGLA